MTDILLESPLDFLGYPLEPRVFEWDRGRIFIPNILANPLHFLRDRVDEIFCIRDLLLDKP